jgi:hypothetical protein
VHNAYVPKSVYKIIPVLESQKEIFGDLILTKMLRIKYRSIIIQDTPLKLVKTVDIGNIRHCKIRIPIP